VHLVTPDGRRTAGARRLLHPGALRAGEVIVAVEFPRMSDREGWGFCELSRPGAYAFPLVTVAATVRLAANGAVRRLRAAVTGAAPVPYCLGDAAGLLTGRQPDQEWSDAVADVLVQRGDPADDQYASAAYRRRMVRHLSRAALADAVRRTAVASS
jgi:CO/xanthine dehydrogenase FAD-binding subunit